MGQTNCKCDGLVLLPKDIFFPWYVDLMIQIININIQIFWIHHMCQKLRWFILLFNITQVHVKIFQNTSWNEILHLSILILFKLHHYMHNPIFQLWFYFEIDPTICTYEKSLLSSSCKKYFKKYYIVWE
jgi:hypothetical protein